MVDFASKLKDKAKLFQFSDAEFIEVPTEKQLEYETAILFLDSQLRGSKSPEHKNAAVIQLRRLCKRIKQDITERNENT